MKPVGSGGTTPPNSGAVENHESSPGDTPPQSPTPVHQASSPALEALGQLSRSPPASALAVDNHPIRLNARFSVSPAGVPSLEKIQQRNHADQIDISTPGGIDLSPGQKEALTNGRLYEAGVSMTILDHPGQVGKVFDEYGAKLSTVLQQVLGDGAAGKMNVHFNGTEKPLADVFRDTTLTPMTAANSDQIGRKTERDGDGARWLLAGLETPSTGPSGNYAHGQDFKNMLMKMKSVCAFGTTVWQLMNQGDAPKRQQNQAALSAALSPLGHHVADSLGGRFDEFRQRMRTDQFDDAISRMRSERQPLGEDGQPIPVRYESAGLHGLGFGNVAVTAASVERQAELDQKLGVTVNGAGKKVYANINGAQRQGAPIESGPSSMPERPFMMAGTEIRPGVGAMNAYQNLMFKQTGGEEHTFLEALEAHEFPHGTGVNRWQPNGTFAVESNLRGLPSAGAQSGGMCDALLGLNVINDTTLFDDHKTVEPATLGIAAFMNFGGYHTFAETVPVGMAMANNDDQFNPSSGTRNSADGLVGDKARLHDEYMSAPVGTNLMHDSLYSRVGEMVKNYTSAPQEQVDSLKGAYTERHGQLCETYPELRAMQRVDIETTRERQPAS